MCAYLNYPKTKKHLMSNRPDRSLHSAEELANALTHGIGFVCALMGGIWLWQHLPASAPAKWLAGAGIFAAGMCLVYAASTVYHAVQHPLWKFRLRKLDHISIYFLIAGTHTPLVLRYLSGELAVWYLSVLWGLVAVGIAYKVLFFGRWPWFSLGLYLALGWMAVFVLPVMRPLMPQGVWWSIVMGGLSYTIGVVFFVWKKLPFAHTIWHLFVMAGTAAHFVAVAMALQ